jgi:hypothetical protein
MTNEDLLKKWQLKKIAILAFISDECDDMKPRDKRAFYSMAEAIFDEVIGDLKLLATTAVSESVQPVREGTVCDCDKWHDRMEESNNHCSSCDKPIK